MTIAHTTQTTEPVDNDAGWADLSGRWFFAWRMAAACEGALREVNTARESQEDPGRAQALERVSSLLEAELMRWVRRGEALDMIVDHLPRNSG
jgi:hypothetical protein